jgi:DNA-binding LacI/PurR family transcriptional regulator
MATMNDVAKAAGVSLSTVSYVLSGKRTISEETREQVLAAIRKLDYSPHSGARSLASNRSNVLGLMVPLRADVNVSVIMQFVAGVVTTARDYNQDVLLLTQDDAEGIHRVTSQSIVDGLLMMDIEARDPRIPQLAKLRKPAGLSCVDFDFAAASRTAVRHLTELGHRSIGFIGSPPASLQRHATYADRARKGFEDACEAAGVNASLKACEPTSGALAGALDAMLWRHEPPTALVVHNEGLLPLLREALALHGLQIPNDISVVAIAPEDAAMASIPAHDIGRAAVEMVMDRLNSDKPVEIRLIVPSLVQRETSTAPS